MGRYTKENPLTENLLQFQTHQTPVRIAVGERAEFGTNEYFPYASTLEGIVSTRSPAYGVASKLITH